MKNQKKFLAKFAAEADEKFDFREGDMASPKFMEWMRSQYAAYDRAIEKDVRAMSKDEFKAKWLEERMRQTIDPTEATSKAFIGVNKRKEGIVWAIDEMLADFDCIVADDHSEKIKDMHHWIDARMSEANDSNAPHAPAKLRLLNSFRTSFDAFLKDDNWLRMQK
jgi:hypothetical protein